MVVGKTRRTRAQSWRWREWGEGKRDQAGVLVLGQMATRGLGQGTGGGGEGQGKQLCKLGW